MREKSRKMISRQTRHIREVIQVQAFSIAMANVIDDPVDLMASARFVLHCWNRRVSQPQMAIY
jgi:hypothetical protein